MKNKNTGFSLIELLLVVTIIGILATIAVPSYLSLFARGRDTERLTNIQKMARIITLNEGEGAGAGFRMNLEEFRDVLAGQGVVVPESTAAHCYVYGGKGDSFFVAIMSEEKDGTFIIDGVKDAVNDFETEAELKLQLESCGPLTNPTKVHNYELFYVQ